MSWLLLFFLQAYCRNSLCVCIGWSPPISTSLQKVALSTCLHHLSCLSGSALSRSRDTIPTQPVWYGIQASWRVPHWATDFSLLPSRSLMYFDFCCFCAYAFWVNNWKIMAWVSTKKPFLKFSLNSVMDRISTYIYWVLFELLSWCVLY